MWPINIYIGMDQSGETPSLFISHISHPKTTGNIHAESTKDPCRMSFRFLSMAERHDLIPKKESNQEKSQSQFYFHGLQIIKWGYKKDAQRPSRD